MADTTELLADAPQPCTGCLNCCHMSIGCTRKSQKCAKTVLYAQFLCVEKYVMASLR